MLSPDTLVNIETCDRRAKWSLEWEAQRVHPTKALYLAIEQALPQKEREDRGQFAGEIVMDICAERGLDVASTINRYDCGLHHAALADILVTYLELRYGAVTGAPVEMLAGRQAKGDCFKTAAGCLMRPILVDHLSDERIKAEAHSWYTLLPVAMYGLPMTLEIIVLGQSKSGRRHSAWSTGFLHPRNHALRFQKRTDKRGLTTGFVDSWRKIWREEYAQVTREEWLQAMREDGQVEQLTKQVTVNPFPAGRRKSVLELASRKLSRLSPDEFPDPSYSACDWPRPCPFHFCCFGVPERLPAEEDGFAPHVP